MKYIAVLLFIIILLPGCIQQSDLKSNEIIGYWRYVGKGHLEKINILHVNDSALYYYLESSGIYSFKYRFEADSIFFFMANAKSKSSTEVNGVEVDFMPHGYMLIKGARIDTLKKIPEKVGDSLSYEVASRLKNIELIKPEVNR